MKKQALEKKADQIFLRRIIPFLENIISCIPQGTKVYLVGGTLRNLFVYPHHPKLKIKQRDYDLVVFGKHKQFIINLIRKGFVKGSIERKYQTVLKRPIFTNAKSLDDFAVLDIGDSMQLGVKAVGNIKDFIAKKVNFTVNGLGINIRDLMADNWRKDIISPFKDRAMRDLKNARLKLNPKKRRFFPSDIFACVRFVAAGFSPPPQKEIAVLKKAFIKHPPENLEIQKQKLFSYTDKRLIKKALVKLELRELF